MSGNGTYSIDAWINSSQPYPDLTPSWIVSDVNSSNVGDTVNLSYSVTNVGSLDMTSTYDIFFILSDPYDVWNYYNSFTQGGSGGTIVRVNTELSTSDDDEHTVITEIDLGNGVYDENEDFIDWNGDDEYNQGEEWTEDVNGNGTFDNGYSSTGKDGDVEVGSADNYTFSDELKELIANFGLEYWYTDNFVLRAGYIYDREGKILNPTFGAGIKFGQYGFDFGYTAGESDHARANTMFFSISMDL